MGRVRITTAVVLVLVVAVGAGVLGYLSRETAAGSTPIRLEKLIAKAPDAPRLPVFEPGRQWSALPKPAPPSNQATSTETVESVVEVEEEAPEVYESVEEPIYVPPTEESSSGGGRCYGITFGPTC